MRVGITRFSVAVYFVFMLFEPYVLDEAREVTRVSMMRYSLLYVYFYLPEWQINKWALLETSELAVSELVNCE